MAVRAKSANPPPGAPLMVWSALSLQNFVGFVDFLEADFDVAAGFEIDLLADVVCGDGKLAAAAVDDHCQVYHTRPAEVDEVIDCRAHRAAGVQDVVEQHDDLVGDVEWNTRVIDGAAGQ